MGNPYPTKVDCERSLPCDYLLPCWGGPDREGSNTHLSHQESGHEGICALRPTPAREMVGHEEPPTMTYSFCVGMVSDDYSCTHPPPHGGVCEGVGLRNQSQHGRRWVVMNPPLKEMMGGKGAFTITFIEWGQVVGEVHNYLPNQFFSTPPVPSCFICLS